MGPIMPEKDLDYLLSRVGESTSMLYMYFSYLYILFDRKALIDIYLFLEGWMAVGCIC